MNMKRYKIWLSIERLESDDDDGVDIGLPEEIALIWDPDSNRVQEAWQVFKAIAAAAKYEAIVINTNK